MESLKELIILAKENGAIGAAWLLVFAGVVWIGGRGSKIALTNVTTMLKQSEDLRVTMQAQLRGSDEERERLHTENRRLSRQMEDLRQTLVRVQQDLEDERNARTDLNSRMNVILEELRVLRRTSQA